MNPVQVGDAVVPPVFMFGFERSGTTLLSMMVGAHPRIAVPLTVTGLWYRYHRGLSRYGGLSTRADVERLVDDLLGEERIQLWDVELRREDVLDGLPLHSYSAIVERFHVLYARSKDKPLWGNLDIATLDDMDVANLWFPNARFLHIVRDGRDVALSHETMPYNAGNTLDTAQNWCRRIRMSQKMGAIIGSERYRLIRYEDLILDTEATLRQICAFIGVSYAGEMMSYPSMVDEKVPDDRRWLWPALDQPPDKSKVYAWKHKMRSGKRIVFESEAKPVLDDLGYETFEHVPKRWSAYAFELWCLVGRGGRFRRLASTVGLRRRRSVLERSWKPSRDYQNRQKTAFKDLVASGVYGADFDHAPAMKTFFLNCMRHAYGWVESDAEINVLECGCGPGAWLDVTSQLDPEGQKTRLFGFDLTPEMVEVARERLFDRVPREHLRAGDILDDGSYAFDTEEQQYQIIYAFDVVQQLPRRRQLAAVDQVARRLAPGGCALIFDHERWSKHGIRMGLRKLATKYLKVSLVPLYYCNARYPALSRIGSKLAATGDFSTEIRVAPHGNKRALLIKKLSSTARASDASHPRTRDGLSHGIA